MADHDLFVKYNETTEQFEIKRLKATFYDRDQQRIKFDDSEQYWREFVNKWWHHSDLRFENVAPTEAQELRLLEVNEAGIPVLNLSEVADYVQYGAINAETSVPFLAEKAGDAEVIEANLTKERARLQQDLASRRYVVETGGATAPDGTRVLTDRESQAQLTSAYQTLKEGLRSTVDWKAPTGWVEVTFEDLAPIAQFAATHVQLAFSAERRVSEEIDAITDMEALQEFQVGEVFEAKFAELWATETAE